MKINKQKVNLVDGVITHTENEIIKTEKTWLEKDILLNVGFKESLIRCFAALLLPPILLIDHHLYVALAITIFYFFMTGLVHFDPARYAWRHWVKHIVEPAVCDFAIDLNVPVKEI